MECSGDVIVQVGMVTCMPDIRNEKTTRQNRLPSAKLDTMATSKYGQRDVLIMFNISRPSSSYSCKRLYIIPPSLSHHYGYLQLVHVKSL